MDDSDDPPITAFRKSLEARLARWDPMIEEGCGETLSLYLGGESDLLEAFAQIPPDDVLEEAVFTGAGVTDQGLGTFLGNPRQALRSLVIRSNAITGRGLRCLQNAPNLNRLLLECGPLVDGAGT